MKDYTELEGVKTKGGKQYVQNKELLKEIIKSKERDQLTDTAVLYLQLIAENLAKKKHYKCIEDKDEFDKEYIDKLYIRFFEQLDRDGIELTDYDREYIDGMMNNLEEDFKNGAYRKKDSSEDE